MRHALEKMSAGRSALAIAVFVIFGLTDDTSGQTLPPSLQGEVLQATSFRVSDEIAISANCTMTPGDTVTVTYDAEGIAFGPYPGTFTERGTATFLLTTPVGSLQVVGTVTSWVADFTIDSVVGQVTGTKTLDPAGVSPNIGVCQEYSFQASPTQVDLRHFVQVMAAFVPLSYEATILSAGARYADQGAASASIREQCVGLTFASCEIDHHELFNEQFLLSTGVLPLDTTGKATGGGQIGDNGLLGRVVSFGFEVKQPELGRLQGRCLVNDPAANARVKCLTVTSYQQVANTATWEGTAEVNGVREPYRITVQDNGEPNQGIDVFSITTATYQAAGNVQYGNVQLHKQKLLTP
jgi:hypothetical protein